MGISYISGRKEIPTVAVLLQNDDFFSKSKRGNPIEKRQKTGRNDKKVRKSLEIIHLFLSLWCEKSKNTI